MHDISIGLLELGYREKADSLTALQQILDYAVEADRLHFKRFWLGEHHNPVTAYTNPDILIALIAGMTESIRVGSAGNLVKLYEPYCLVTNFKLLNNLFANRIDLGLSKGNPGTQYTRTQIFDIRDRDLFNDKVQAIHELLHHEQKNFDEREIVIPPFSGEAPELWYLSNSYRKFDDAITYKLNYYRSLFHGLDLADKACNKEELEEKREAFYTQNGYYPKVSLAIGVSIAKTIQQASKNYKMGDDSKKDPGTRAESWRIIPVTISSLYDRLHEYQLSYGINEFILYDTARDNAKKIDNIQMINQAFHL